MAVLQARAQHRLWVVSGEIGGSEHLVCEEIVEELTEKGTETSTDCATIPKRFAPLVFDGKLHLEGCRVRRSMRRWDLGVERSEAAQMVWPLTKESS